MNQNRNSKIRILFIRISAIIFITIGTIEAATVSGYLDNSFRYPNKMKLWTFTISNDILYDNTEISSSKSECVKALSCKNNRIVKFLPTNVDKKFPNLVAYQIRNGEVKSIEYKHFEKLNELRLLDLYDNHIATISSNAFKDLVKLKELNLGDNLFKSIERYTLDPLKNLQTLIFTKNQIKTVSHYAFDGLIDLRNISLQNNKLESWNHQYITENNKIEYIWLNQNLLKDISVTSFRSKSNLKFIDLRDNSCIDNLFYKSNFLLMEDQIENNCPKKEDYIDSDEFLFG